MRRGDFASAWTISDRVLHTRIERGEDCCLWPRHLQFLWRGQSLYQQRVLVRCYHGLGDTIQFARLLGPLRKIASEVVVWCQPSLMQILESVEGTDQLSPLHEGVPAVEYDIDVEIMELAHILRITPETLPAEVPYIYVSNQQGRSARTGALRVGISWLSGEWNPQRSIPYELLSTLGDIPNVQWNSLQYEGASLPFSSARMACKDIALMARRMLALDLVISVDTMTAHLAGALGLPVWTLLPVPSDWRWMSAGRMTPWYPTMELFRQPSAGDWRAVILEVRERLSTRAARVTRGRDTRSSGYRAFSS